MFRQNTKWAYRHSNFLFFYIYILGGFCSSSGILWLFDRAFNTQPDCKTICFTCSTPLHKSVSNTMQLFLVFNSSHVCIYCMSFIALKRQVCWNHEYIWLDMKLSYCTKLNDCTSPGRGQNTAAVITHHLLTHLCTDTSPQIHTDTHRRLPRPGQSVGRFQLVLRMKLDMSAASLPSLFCIRIL